MATNGDNYTGSTGEGEMIGSVGGVVWRVAFSKATISKVWEYENMLSCRCDGMFPQRGTSCTHTPYALDSLYYMQSWRWGRWCIVTQVFHWISKSHLFLLLMPFVMLDTVHAAHMPLGGANASVIRYWRWCDSFHYTVHLKMTLDSFVPALD